MCANCHAFEQHPWPPPRVHCRSPRHYCVMHLVATYSVGRRILEWAGGLRSERRARLRDLLSTRDGINPDDRIMSPAQARADSRVRSRSHAATSRPMEPSSKVPQSIPASSMPMACTVNTGGRACSPASGRQYRRLRAAAPSGCCMAMYCADLRQAVRQWHGKNLPGHFCAETSELGKRRSATNRCALLRGK